MTGTADDATADAAVRAQICETNRLSYPCSDKIAVEEETQRRRVRRLSGATPDGCLAEEVTRVYKVTQTLAESSVLSCAAALHGLTTTNLAGNVTSCSLEHDPTADQLLSNTFQSKVLVEGAATAAKNTAEQCSQGGSTDVVSAIRVGNQVEPESTIVD